MTSSHVLERWEAGLETIEARTNAMAADYWFKVRHRADLTAVIASAARTRVQGPRDTVAIVRTSWPSAPEATYAVLIHEAGSTHQVVRAPRHRTTERAQWTPFRHPDTRERFLDVWTGPRSDMPPQEASVLSAKLTLADSINDGYAHIDLPTQAER